MKRLTPTPPQHQQQARKTGITRKRATTLGKLDSSRFNQLSREEMEWMSDDPVIRNYANWSQTLLYGDRTLQMAHPQIMQRYPPPSRDIEDINYNLQDMTLNDHHYQIGGPQGPVNLHGIDYFTDVSGIQDYSSYQQARQLKGFSGYTLFTEREEEIGILRRLKIQGVLKDEVEINYGYQERGRHGAVAWLTHAGQEIGGRQREQYERERAIEGRASHEFTVYIVIPKGVK